MLDSVRVPCLSLVLHRVVGCGVFSTRGRNTGKATKPPSQRELAPRLAIVFLFCGVGGDGGADMGHIDARALHRQEAKALPVESATWTLLRYAFGKPLRAIHVFSQPGEHRSCRPRDGWLH